MGDNCGCLAGTKLTGGSGSVINTFGGRDRHSIAAARGLGKHWGRNRDSQSGHGLILIAVAVLDRTAQYQGQGRDQNIGRNHPPLRLEDIVKTFTAFGRLMG